MVLATTLLTFGLGAAEAQTNSPSVQLKSTFYPLTEGSWWKYKKTVTSYKGEKTTTSYKDEVLPSTSKEAHSAVKFKGIQPIVLKRTSDDSKENRLIYFTVKDGWISQVGTDACSYSSAMRILPLDPKPPQKWTDSGTGKGATPDMSFTMEFTNKVSLIAQKNPQYIVRQVEAQKDTYQKSVGLVRSHSKEMIFQGSPPQITEVELVAHQIK